MDKVGTAGARKPVAFVALVRPPRQLVQRTCFFVGAMPVTKPSTHSFRCSNSTRITASPHHRITASPHHRITASPHRKESFTVRNDLSLASLSFCFGE
ncbi:hypothetical protein J7432_18160 [Xanthomonas axonopodis pv. begoniae]|nr:hypothetical protein [Xanthomonas axonopodis pv. begoniae]